MEVLELSWTISTRAVPRNFGTSFLSKEAGNQILPPDQGSEEEPTLELAAEVEAWKLEF